MQYNNGHLRKCDQKKWIKEEEEARDGTSDGFGPLRPLAVEKTYLRVAAGHHQILSIRTIGQRANDVTEIFEKSEKVDL